MTPIEPETGTGAGPPWWQFPMVWLVIGGPAAVVVASLVTAGFAFVGADVVVRDPVTPKAGGVTSQAPALQARNHAATASP